MCWLLFVPKGALRFYHPPVWIILPLVYAAAMLIRGHFGGMLINQSRYPYPFMDVDVLGAGRVAATIAVLVLVFVLIGELMVLLDHLLARIAKRMSSRRSL